MTVALTEVCPETTPAVPLTELEDAELVCAARNGCEEAFEQLVQRHSAQLRRNVSGIVSDADCDDVSQKAWLTIYRKLHTLRTPKYFYSWANRITVNTALALVRKRGRRSISDIDDLPRSKMPADEGVDAEERVEWRNLLEKTKSWFHELDQRDRRMFRYFLVDGMSMAEISERVDLSEGGVKTRLFRARQKLRARRDAAS